VDPVGGFNTIALAQIPFNGGEAKYQGLDWDANWRSEIPFGFFTARCRERRSSRRSTRSARVSRS
jgi:hypothetical protein